MRQAALTLLVAIAAAGALGTRARAQSPVSAHSIFGCPLATAAEPAPGQRDWPATQRRWPTLGGIGGKLASWLKPTATAPQRVDLASRSFRLSLRRTTGPAAGGLAVLKRTMEGLEGGPSLVSLSCERAALATLLPRSSALFEAARLSFGPRPLGARRRTVTLLLQLRDGTVLTAVLTAWWKGRAGPNYATMRRILRAVAASEPIPATPAVVRAE